MTHDLTVLVTAKVIVHPYVKWYHAQRSADTTVGMLNKECVDILRTWVEPGDPDEYTPARPRMSQLILTWPESEERDIEEEQFAQAALVDGLVGDSFLQEVESCMTLTPLAGILQHFLQKFEVARAQRYFTLKDMNRVASFVVPSSHWCLRVVCFVLCCVMRAVHDGCSDYRYYWYG